jgi:hypothetical protein
MPNIEPKYKCATPMKPNREQKLEKNYPILSTAAATGNLIASKLLNCYL